MKHVLMFASIFSLALMAFTLPSAKQRTHSTEKVVYGGIKFDKTSMKKALSQAKSSGKLIFIDVYTTWCGPCKEMARTTFQSDEVGKLFNKKFINLKLDAENETDGQEVAQTYGVSAFPTLLFINGDGKLVKKLVGKQSEEKLLSIANAL